MNCVLRLVQESDLAMVLEWRNAEEVRNNMYTNHVISVDEHRTWWTVQRNNPKTRLLICELDDVPVGVITFTNICGPDGTATWAFYSGSRAKRGVGMAMELAALEYAFNDLQLRRLECEVLGFNDTVIRFHLKHGFLVEGIFREAYVRDGKAYDVYSLAMLAKDWFAVIRPTILSRNSAATVTHDYTGKRFSCAATLDSDAVTRFAIAVKDHNPVHFDDVAARQAGFESRVAHGMLIGSLFSGFFSREFPGPGTIYLGQTLDFRSPVAVGAVVTLRMRVLSHIGRRLIVETHMYANDCLCVAGQATLLVPKNSSQEVGN